MTPSHAKIEFRSHQRTVWALEDSTLVEAAAQAGLILDTPCGGAGRCGKCRARIVSGEANLTEASRTAFSEAERAQGWCLACQTTVRAGQDLVVELPRQSLYGGTHQIVVSRTTGAVNEVAPGIRKVYVELPPPTLMDCQPDESRLERAIGEYTAGIGMARELPQRLRETGFRGTAVLSCNRLIAFESGNTEQDGYAAAFDIGTTTMAGVLLHLATGEERGVVSRMNPQTAFGDDVLSRIAFAATNPGALERLRTAVISEIASMIAALCHQAGIRQDLIYEASFAGNTAMEHLLCGIDPSALGQAPFAPAFAHGLRCEARELGIPIHPRGNVHVFPVIGGFVGGDTVACMLSTRLLDNGNEGPVLMIDVGTNGEIVLAHQGRAWAASTAAGPAFEGARISCGMRATTGAIEKAVIDGDLRLNVIGNVEPRGLCGSGLIDLCAQLLDHGIAGADGRLCAPDALPGALSDAVRARVREDAEHGRHLVLHETPAHCLRLLQQDLRELQLASGAIRAGITLLLRRAGLEPANLSRVLIAGGFGSFIRRNHAQRIGLLPGGIPHERIHYVGNASLGGAVWTALSRHARTDAETLARQTEHVELSNDEDFAMEFAMAMRFPEPEA